MDGLLFIHQELSLYHGGLDCSAVLLDSDGAVKIGESTQIDQLQLLTSLANIGDSVVGNRQLDTENERCDIGSVGSVMMELMEPPGVGSD